MNNKKIILENRQIGLDIYRLVAVLFVFLFHSNMHIGCNYGIFTCFISMGAIFMTAFFLLSGYVLFITYKRVNLTKIKSIKNFYIKRGLSILPLYYVVSILFIVFLGTETIKENLILVPVEIMGLQSVFSSIFSVTHNGGTWFISCIILCYLLYPYIQEVIKQISVRNRILMIGLSTFIIIWSPIIVYYFKTSQIYSNPFFRILEFLIGVLLASLKETTESIWKNKFIMSRKAVLIESILLLGGVSLGVKNKIFVGNYMMYNWIALPIFILLIISISGINVRRTVNIKLVGFLCKRTYAFFLAQFFTWKLARLTIKFLECKSNIAKIIIVFVINALITLILHDVVE